MARILVIDDDESYRVILREFIEAKGHTVIEAESADKGMDVFLHEKIDLVVSDMMMPGKSGMDLLAELREINPKVLFIMVTGYPAVEMATEAIKRGAYDYLVKPIDIGQLSGVMSRALGTLDLRSNLSTVRGLNAALLFSIPIWVVAGWLIRSFFFGH